jgi:hypothetical protein
VTSSQLELHSESLFHEKKKERNKERKRKKKERRRLIK